MKKIFNFLMIAFTAFAFMLSSCQKDSIDGMETGNPMPGKWYANQVDYEGLLVDFNVEINSVFNEGEGLYAAEGQQIGRMEVTHEGEPVMAANIQSCIYNERTHTGRFVIHYDDDEDPEYVFTMDFYYDVKKDRFTVISISYNITFCRR